MRLRPPPRTPVRTKISRLLANCPAMAGLGACGSSRQNVTWELGVVLEPLSLPAKIGFPETETGFAETRFESSVNRREDQESNAV